MGNNFDPMTGEPIVTQPAAETSAVETPAAEASVAETPAAEAPVTETPEVETPIAEATQQPEVQVSYDPMTGEKIVANSQPTGNMAFDPMTGERIVVDATQTIPPVSSIPPVTPIPPTGTVPPVAPAKKKGPLVGILIGVGALAAILLVLLIAVIAKNIALGKNGKFIVAAQNTFKPSKVVEDLNMDKVMYDGDGTIGIQGTIEDFTIDGAYAMDVNKFEYSANGTFAYDDMSVTTNFSLDENRAQLAIPEIIDSTFIYTFGEEKDGYVADLLDDSDIDIEEIDEFVAASQQAGKKKDALQKDMEKVAKKQFNSLDFKKADKETCKVNGKNRKCQGYTVTIDEDTVNDWCDAFEDVYVGYYEDNFGDIKLADDLVDAQKEAFDNIRDAADRMKDVDVTVYLYKKQIAKILIDSREDVEIEFYGGETPTESFAVVYDGDTVFEKIGSTEKSVQKVSYEVDGDEFFTMEYNYRKGDLTAECEYDGDEYFTMEGVLKSSKRGMNLQITELAVAGEDVDIDAVVYAKDKADIVKMPKPKDEFDVGNASEDDWEDIEADLEDTMEDFEDEYEDEFEGFWDSFYDLSRSFRRSSYYY